MSLYSFIAKLLVWLEFVALLWDDGITTFKFILLEMDMDGIYSLHILIISYY